VVALIFAIRSLEVSISKVLAFISLMGVEALSFGKASTKLEIGLKWVLLIKWVKVINAFSVWMCGWVKCL
jgi:hypothetical protein